MAQSICIEKLPNSIEKLLQDLGKSQKRIAVALELIADLLEPEAMWSLVDQDKHITEWMKKESEAKRDTDSGDSDRLSDGTHCA